MGIEAVQLFNQLSNEILGDWIYVCVLNACSHSGLVHQAKEIFEKIPINERTNQIYTTMVKRKNISHIDLISIQIDVLSRGNHFDEAQALIKEFEEKNPPYLSMYSQLNVFIKKRISFYFNLSIDLVSILSAARNQHNICLSQKIFDRIKQFFPQIKPGLASARVLLANTYASKGDFSRASTIRKEIVELGLKKQIGISKTVVNGQIQVSFTMKKASIQMKISSLIQEFRAHDKSHPDSNKISEELNRLNEELISHGYVPDSSWITRPIGNDETVQSILNGHSERLAIGLNLIQKPIPSPIQVVKNLRICGDCRQ